MGLASDASATSLNSIYENQVNDPDETDAFNPRHSWVVSNDHSGTTLTPGTEYTIYIMVKVASGSLGRVNFGGGFGPINIFATALPATAQIYDGT